MPRFYKHKLLFDEGMSPQKFFPSVNARYDIKHIGDDFHLEGVDDTQVYEVAVQQERLIVTYNLRDFRTLVTKSDKTGIIGVSSTLSPEQLDTKLAALLRRSTPRSLYGKVTELTGETDF